MPIRPRYPSIPREDPLPSEPPPHGYVTRAEVERMLSETLSPIHASLRRIEGEAVEARKERLLRKQWEEEKRSEELTEAIREKTRSESDFIKAIHTPLAFPVPKAPDSNPARRAGYNKTHVIGALIAAIATIAVAAIGACESQRSAPHGAIEGKP